MLTPGDPAPWFSARGAHKPQFHLNTAAGRYVVLCFFGSAADPAARRVLDDLARHGARFDGANALFVGVGTDPEDEAQKRLDEARPGVEFCWDVDHAVGSRYHAAPAEGGAGYCPQTLVLGPDLRVLGVFPLGGDGEGHLAAVLRFLDALPPVASRTGHAPVLVVPWVFEPDVCRALVGLYEEHGGRESGFMRDVGGKTVEVMDPAHKRRKDYHLEDDYVIGEVRLRLQRRLFPEIKKAFQFQATHIERYVVACYDSSDGAHFRAHRDNTTKATAHRRFAVSINLNAEGFDGGELWFPEYGPRSYRPPTGGAVVFSCSLLHEAKPVTRGKRYAFLPFLYDEAGARTRRANLKYLATERPPAGVTSGPGVVGPLS